MSEGSFDHGKLLPESNGGLSFETFPLELKHCILSALPDVSTLRAALLSHSSIYHAFKVAENIITTDVLHNQIPANLLPDARIVLDSSRLNLWSRDKVTTLLANYTRRRGETYRKWTLSDAVRVSKLYEHVSFFSKDLANEASSLWPKNRFYDPLTDPLSSTEIFRLCRSFYRFELYCNLFRQYAYEDERYTRGEQKAIFFDLHSPWENEQLACVHDYLFRRMSTPYNDVASHDISWGKDCMPYQLENDFLSPDLFKQYILSLGLAFLHQLITEETYEKRYQLLQPTPQMLYEFLFEGLLGSNKNYQDWKPLRLFTEDEERTRVRQPLDKDPDIGPERAWRWAHHEIYASSFIMAHDNHDLRGNAYVMWDNDRLEGLGLCSETCASPPEEHVYKMRSRTEVEVMERSFVERTNIWIRGGRGWWAEGDESKIVWLPQEKQPSTSKRKRDRIEVSGQPALSLIWPESRESGPRQHKPLHFGTSYFPDVRHDMYGGTFQ